MKKSTTIILAAAAIALTGCGGGGSNPAKNSASKFDLDLLPCSYRSGGTPIIAYEKDGEEIFRFEGEPKNYTGIIVSNMLYDGRAYIMSGDFNGFVDKEGNELFEVDGKANPYMTEGLAIVLNDKNIAAYNAEGEIVWEIEGRSCAPMREGYALFQDRDNNFGIINSKGEVVFEPDGDEYLTYFAYETDIAAMAHPTYYQINNNQGLAYILDVKTGKHYLEDCAPDNLSDREGLFVDCNNLIVAKAEGEGYGLLDLDGNWVVEPEYDNLRNDGEWYMFRENGTSEWGWIDKDGNVKIEPIADFPRWWRSGGFGYGDIAYIGDGRFIDRKGNIVLETDLGVDSNFIGDRCLIDKGREGYTWMNRQGEEICDPFPLEETAKEAIRKLSAGGAPQYSVF